MYRRHLARESGGPAFDLYRLHKGTHGEPQGGTVMVNGCRESDNLIVSGKPANKIRDRKRIAEQVERRGLAKGNQVKQNRVRTQSREALQSELDRIRQVAQRGKRVQFTAMWHHVYSIRRLKKAYLNVKRRAPRALMGRAGNNTAGI